MNRHDELLAGSTDWRLRMSSNCGFTCAEAVLQWRTRKLFISTRENAPDRTGTVA